MLLRAFAITLTLLIGAPAVGATAGDAADSVISAGVTPPTLSNASPGDTTPTGDTINPFYPEQRSLGDCLSSLPKPGCGSEARGGWRQTVVLGVLLSGLAFIGWRIVRQSRKARAHQ